MLSSRQIDEFVLQHRLPARFCELIKLHYLPLVSWVMSQHHPGETQLIGINGAQGTGKSTLAALVCLALERQAGWRVAVLSIDDFYLTKAERKKLGERVHSLLETRGVPGTHDMQMLATCIKRLKKLAPKESLALPRFDKSQDDRDSPENWPQVSGPIDLIILEGWCIGSRPQCEDDLSKPINILEQKEDPKGNWRRYVNGQLEGAYADLFAQLDTLIVLHAPNFEVVYHWRLEQEQKLAAVASDNAPGIMNCKHLEHFIQHYERLTRMNLAALHTTADVVLELDQNHDCVRSCYAKRNTGHGGRTTGP
jgi:D-glycerate 3-kinase